MQSNTNASAILRGEQRSTRHKYRHTLAGAAHDLGIPTGWVWFWHHEERLPSKNWLRRIWVRLEHAQGLFSDLKSVYDAFYATGEPLTSPQAIQEVLGRWPEFPEQMYVSALQPTRVIPFHAKADAAPSNPVLCEEAA